MAEKESSKAQEEKKEVVSKQQKKEVTPAATSKRAPQGRPTQGKPQTSRYYGTQRGRPGRGGRSDRFKRGKDKRRRKDESELDRRVISTRRVAKVTSGAKRLRFSALVVVGDRKGKLGIGLGRGGDPRSAIEKGGKYASTHLAIVEILGDTIPHRITNKYRAATVLLKPAGAGTGIIASNAVRSVLEMAGVKNVLTKQLGSNDPIANAYCTFEALKMLKKRRILEKRAEKLKSKLKKDETSKPKKTKK